MTSDFGPLASVFRERVATGVAIEEDLGAKLGRVLAEAQTAWPAIAVDGDTFVRHLAERYPKGGALAAFCTSDLYLACACLAGLSDAHLAFDRYCLAGLAPSLARVDPTPAFTDEVLQLVRCRLWVAEDGAPPKLELYDGLGSLKGWVRTMALRVALNLKDRKSDTRVADDSSAMHNTAGAADPELELLRVRYKKEFEEAVRDSMESLDAQERTLLRLHDLEGMTLKKLATLYGVGHSTVDRRLRATRSRLNDEMRQRLAARLRLSSSEVDSIAGVLQSDLEVSIRRLLTESSPPK